MKTKTKPRRQARGRSKRAHHEENIFNPFAPVITAIKQWSGRRRIESVGSFRGAFITVLLVHIAAALAITGYNAMGKGAKKNSSSSFVPKGGESALARRLDELTAGIVPNGHAKVGGRLEPVREDDLDRAKPTPSAESRDGAPRTLSNTAKSNDSLPPPATKSPVAKSQNTAQTQSAPAAENAAKRAFLEATGRLEAQPRLPAKEPAATKAEPLTGRATDVQSGQRTATSEYVVQPGDNIFTIVKRMNASFAELAEANNLSSPRDVRVGQTLVAPGQERL